jgi:hypothetical protein
MTLERAERITGLAVFLIPGQDCIYAAGVRLTPREEALVACGDTVGAALATLVDANLAAVFARVAERQRWRCADCNRIRSLHLHHLRYRSHGREDTDSNCICLCFYHHEKRHREQRAAAFGSARLQKL